MILSCKSWVLSTISAFPNPSKSIKIFPNQHAHVMCLLCFGLGGCAERVQCMYVGCVHYLFITECVPTVPKEYHGTIATPGGMARGTGGPADARQVSQSVCRSVSLSLSVCLVCLSVCLSVCWLYKATLPFPRAARSPFRYIINIPCDY